MLTTYDNFGLNNSTIQQGDTSYSNFGIIDSSGNGLSTIPNLVTGQVSASALNDGQLRSQITAINGFLQSSNFKTGVSGWQISADGNVEFASGYFRGDITGASGTFSGSITASSGSIGGWTIGATTLTGGGVTLNSSTGNISGATITGSTLTTASSGQRVVLNSSDIRLYDSSNNIAADIFGYLKGMYISTANTYAYFSMSESGTNGYISISNNTNAYIQDPSTGISLVNGSGNGLTARLDGAVSFTSGIYLGGVLRTSWPTSGTTTLSGLTIDTDKSWSSYAITNLWSLGVGAITSTGNGTFSGVNTFSNSGTGNYFNWIRVTGSSPWVGWSDGRFSLYGATVRYTTLTNDSDSRLKKNISNTSYGLSEIIQLNPVKFEYIQEETPGTHLGFIAQDVESVIPEIISTMDDTDMKCISSTEIIPVLVNAIKELNTRILALEATH